MSEQQLPTEATEITVTTPTMVVSAIKLGPTALAPIAGTTDAMPNSCVGGLQCRAYINTMNAQIAEAVSPEFLTAISLAVEAGIADGDKVYLTVLKSDASLEG